MVIDMDETRLRTTQQLEEFLRATPQVVFTAHGLAGAGDNQRYEHISRVLARFDYPQRNKRERGVVLAYLRRTNGYGRARTCSRGNPQRQTDLLTARHTAREFLVSFWL